MLIDFVMLLFLANSLILIVYSQAPQPGTTFLRVGNGKVLVMRLAYWCCEGESQQACADYVLMKGNGVFNTDNAVFVRFVSLRVNWRPYFVDISLISRGYVLL